jgi:hypothetical protein
MNKNDKKNILRDKISQNHIYLYILFDRSGTNKLQEKNVL